MPSATTTRQKVINYINRSDDVEELKQIAKAIDARRSTVSQAKHEAECMARFDLIRQATVIVRDRDHHRLFIGRPTPTVFTGDRWYVREEYRGRKYRGVFVSRESDTPKSRRGWHWLSWKDCDCWMPEPAT